MQWSSSRQMIRVGLSTSVLGTDVLIETKARSQMRRGRDRSKRIAGKLIPLYSITPIIGILCHVPPRTVRLYHVPAILTPRPGARSRAYCRTRL